VPTVAELNVVINADTKGLEAGLKEADKGISTFGESIKGGLGMGLGFGLVEKGIALVGSAFSAAKGSIIDLNSSLEQSKIAFTTMLGSAEAADAFLQQLQAFAANTPFEFPDLVSASKRMLAFGFESKQVVPLLTAVGDAVAAVGGGAETIDGVTTALGQMQAKGKVSAEEMGQLAERGIPAWDMLAKKMGVSVAEAMDMVSKGGVKASTFIEAFQEGTSQRFGGMMEKQSLTFAGAMSTITDSLQMAVASAFKPFFDLLSEGAVSLSKFVQSEAFAGWASTISGAISTVVASIRSAITLLTGAGADGLPGVLGAVETLLSDFGGTVATIVEGWASAFAGWVDGAGDDLGTNLADLLIGVVGWIQRAEIAIVEKLALWAGAFVDWVAPKIPGLLEQLGALLVKLTVWMLTDALPTIITKLAEWGLAFVEWVGPRIIPLLYELGKLEVELLGWIITTALPAIITKLGEWAAAFVAWVGPQIPPLLLELGKLALEVLGWMTNTALPKIVAALVDWGAAFLGWVAKDVLPSLPEKLGAILTAIGGWISEKAAGVGESAMRLGAAFIQGIQDGIAGALGGFWSWLQTSFVDKIPTFVKDLLKIQSPSGVFADIGRSIVDGLRVGMESRLPSIDDLVERVIGKVGGMSGDVDDWLKAAIQYTGAPASWLEPLKWIVGHESSGDPHAKNPNSTAAGLFQIIDSTWAASRDKALPDDIFNPVINAIGGIRYIKGRYGDPWEAVDFWKAHNHYAEGGIAWTPQLAMVGEREPEAIIPRSWFGTGASSGALQSVSMPIVLGTRVVEEIWIEGRDLAIRRGRVPGAGAASMGSLS
jgi:tape measure domain-containing protein